MQPKSSLFIPGLAFIFGLLAMPVTASAHDVFQDVLKDKYMLKSFSCKTCHPDGDDRTIRTPFAERIYEVMKDKNYSEQFAKAVAADEAAKEQDPDSVGKDKGAVFEFEQMIAKEFDKAFDVVAKQQMTIEDIIKEGLFNGARLDKKKIDAAEEDDENAASVTPDHRRWSINFQVAEIDSYAKALTYFQIDIGVIHQTKNQIWRLRNAVRNPTVISSSRSDEDQTLRFIPQQQLPKQWDREICRGANIELEGASLAHFYPESTRQLLRKVEAAALNQQGRTIEDVRKTTFNVVQSADGFAFGVDEIAFLPTNDADLASQNRRP